MASKQTHRIRRAHAGLVVIDIQERLLPSIHEHERVVENAVRLIRGAAILGIKTVFTEQYRKGLGATIGAVTEAASTFKPIEKLAFSTCGEPAFMNALSEQKITDVILCGIESHVCVSQSCLDLLDQSSRVFVVADAISSRTPQNHQLGMDRMRSAGAVLASTEMILFELLERAGTEEFKQVLEWVK